MSDSNKAREINELFNSAYNETSYYNFKVGGLVNGNIMSHYAALDNIITNTKTGHVLLRFCVKGHAIDLMFKPEDIVVSTSIIEDSNPISFDSIEQALRTIAEEADKKGM